MLMEVIDTVAARDRIATMTDATRAIDAAYARLIRALGSGNAIAAATGLPAQRVVELNGYTRSDARALIACAAEQTNMPLLFDAFERGLVSFSQLRIIVAAARALPAKQRATLDAFLAPHLESLAGSEPQHLIDLADNQILELLSQSARNKRERAADDEFLYLQPKIDGGSRLFGEFNPLSTASIIETLDRAAGRPQGDHDACDHTIDPESGDEICPKHVEIRSRARDYADAFVEICEDHLNNTTTSAEPATRPRARLHAVLDVNRWDDEKESATTLLWGLIGRNPKLTRVATEELLCDATIIPIITQQGRVTHVGDEAPRFSLKTRRGIIARDQGCRAPGCHAPVQHSDIHHIKPGHGNTTDDGVLHCRKDHRRAHRQNWTITLLPNGDVQYVIRGRTYLTRPPP
jgi:hypothetical protein